jgi:hypothetical protein
MCLVRRRKVDLMACALPACQEVHLACNNTSSTDKKLPKSCKECVECQSDVLHLSPGTLVSFNLPSDARSICLQHMQQASCMIRQVQLALNCKYSYEKPFQWQTMALDALRHSYLHVMAPVLQLTHNTSHYFTRCS